MRIEHTHGLNKDKGQGGHYHCDTTAETVEYHGYFSLAECEFSFIYPYDIDNVILSYYFSDVYRVDRPKTTHQIGRD